MFGNMTAFLKAYIPRKGSFFANVLTLMTGTALGQGLALAAAPLLTRLYSPEDFGTLAVYVSISAILVSLASLRYDWAILLPEDNQVAANLLVLCFAILLAMTLLTGLGLLVIKDPLLHWINAPGLSPYLWLVPFSLVAAGAYQILSNWAIRQKAFGRLARTKLSQGLGRALTQVGLGLLNLRPMGLLIGDVIGRAGGGATLAALAWRQEGEALKSVTPSGIWAAARRYRRFPIFSGASTLLNAATPQVPILMLSAFYGAQVVGWFSLGQMVIAVPMSLITMSGSQVFRAEAARLVHTDPRALKRKFYRAAQRLMLGTLPIAFLALISPWVMAPVFGEKWRVAGVYTQALTLMFITQFVALPITHLETHELQHWEFLWDAGRLIITGAIFYVAYRMSFSAHNAIFLYSIGMSFSMIILFFLNFLAINRIINVTSE